MCVFLVQQVIITRIIEARHKEAYDMETGRVKKGSAGWASTALKDVLASFSELQGALMVHDMNNLKAKYFPHGKQPVRVACCVSHHCCLH